MSTTTRKYQREGHFKANVETISALPLRLCSKSILGDNIAQCVLAIRENDGYKDEFNEYKFFFE